jgi:hypothetical protein
MIKLFFMPGMVCWKRKKMGDYNPFTGRDSFYAPRPNSTCKRGTTRFIWKGGR